MLLEELYNNNLGKVFIYLKNKECEHYIPMNFHDYSNIALGAILSDLIMFENANNISSLGTHSVEASCFCFLAIESFVNTILKFLCIDNNDDFSKYKKKQLNQRIVLINKFLGLDHYLFSKTFPQSKLQEFEEFRNEIFHDRLFENEIKFNKTLFSQRPNFPNLISEFQALIIVIDFFNFYRTCIDGVDLMPSILVHKGESFFFDKLDNYYNSILKPSFEFSLEKHKLSTNLSLVLLETKNEICYHPKQFNIMPIIKAVNDMSIDIKFDNKKTNYTAQLYYNYAKRKKLAEKEFGVPCYIKE